LQDNRQVYAYIDVTIKPLTMTIVGPREISAYESVSYTITFNPDSLQKTVNWESSNPKIATVNENGQLTGLKAGQVRLVARLVDNSNVNTYIDVTIKPLVIEEIMITGKTTLAWKESFTYSASCLPLYAPKQFQWSSSDEVIIAIDENGRAEARQIGEAIIRASSIIDPSVYKEVLVSVVHGPLATLVIEGGEEVYVGSTLALKAFDGHEDVSEYIDWTIDDEQKATINTRGIISGLVAGTVIVTATSKLNPELSTTKQITIVFRNYLYYQTKILMIDQVNYQMELLDCPTTKFSATTKVKQKLGDKIINLSLSDLMLGMENVYAQIDVEANLISALLIDGEIGFSNIRVGIRKAINDIALDATLYHDVVEFSVLENMVLKTFDGAQSLAISEGSNLTFTYLNGQIEVKRGNDIIMKTAKRLLLQSLGNNENIQFLSITRANGKPYYHGNMEVAIKNNRLLVVNDLNLEKYLYKVLPSEMPSSFGLEALKAQAIAARTYAYMDVFNKATQAYGYTVDDSVKSQVYNNQNTNEISKRAVNETAGQIMTYNGTPVSAYYYSTSSGLTASGHEVWISKQVGSEIPYLIGQNLAQDDLGKTISFDYRDEASMLAFFKTIKMKTPESALSKYHRWKVSFTKTQLTTTLNKNLKLTYSATPQLVLTKKGDSWLSQTIPSSIGDVTNIYVGERGSSGVVISLIVETTTGIYKIINQYNIRFTVRPKDAGS
ncbi:MAG TPA: SpoIID/LytB domain-containing protein, partial [Bacilli bacterium]|nr:SpoIID/LytB domain-containing protein [Bacilli bacterium]